MTVALDDPREQLKDTEYARKDKAQKTEVEQFERDRGVEVNRRTDLATAEENWWKELARVEKRKEEHKKVEKNQRRLYRIK